MRAHAGDSVQRRGQGARRLGLHNLPGLTDGSSSGRCALTLNVESNAHHLVELSVLPLHLLLVVRAAGSL